MPPSDNPYHFRPEVSDSAHKMRLIHQSIDRLTALAIEDVTHHPYVEMIPASLKSTLFQLAQVVAELGDEVGDGLAPPKVQDGA